MWTKSLKKGIAVNYLLIAIYTNYTNTQQQQQQQKEKKHYHNINIVIREMIFFFFFFFYLPRPSHFPGMNKVYRYWILLFWICPARNTIILKLKVCAETSAVQHIK